ncbi:MAG: glycosyltransferase [Prolixibacteraceae bacterium]|jgi:SAM-dependent methyltransferase|nr:glycosyltransferase [Prolixibacteraceae bacterium]MDI9564678.1 glycosyltransferase [Bacteroidota bacterium]NLS98702.1 glycosyltransferase [Bacteroidales bacterium]OQB81950.1 MAG: Undecaprenyl-phosphate 4-deoxy-4-formamido-L-arabinose transferase [Bacteroidetes bacterium ADurb.Bin123]HNU78687.1 glycosyltransferase [Prolixibacteraceae bacterium]
MNKESRKAYFDAAAGNILRWRKKNRSYHRLLEEYYSFFIPRGSKVLELGSGTGDLLAAVAPEYGVGLDFSREMITLARQRHPELHFVEADAEDYHFTEKFDYILLSDLVGSLWDVQKVFENMRNASHDRTRIIISNYNYLWEPLIQMGERLGFKQKQPLQNWLSVTDIRSILTLAGFETIRTEKKIIFPKNVPLLSWLFNRYVVNLPIFRGIGLTNFIIARPAVERNAFPSVTLVVPARNEKGNIENAILRTPEFGSFQEFIFVEGNSLDGTWEEMLRVKAAYPDKNIRVIRQTGKGKGNAVREGFEQATGDMLFILDADLTTPPEDMPKFYDALRKNRGEFINGCRLVYPMEKQAMRFLNLIANKAFGLIFSYLLGQSLKDTLCGTKVLLRRDYEIIRDNRSYFGDFDPFGDFDLLFGAAKLNLKIAEVNVRYKERSYGSTQISRFKHGWLLIRMTVYAARKLKFF